MIGRTEDALLATIGDRLVEKPELISFPSEPTRREIAALSVIVARCSVLMERLRRLQLDHCPPYPLPESLPVEVAPFEHQIGAFCGLQFGIEAMLPDEQVRSPPDVEGLRSSATDRAPSMA